MTLRRYVIFLGIWNLWLDSIFPAMFYVCYLNFKWCVLVLTWCCTDDHDIVDVFRHIENLQHVDLSSNRITLTTLLQPAYCRNLQSLVLSFNPLGGHVLPLLPTILSKFPRLESLDIESCNVTYTPITDNIREQYQNNGNEFLTCIKATLMNVQRP